jgi:predicted transcriptional regulator
MNAREKAKAGLWLLKQAVLEYVTEHPGITPKEVREALDLNSPNPSGDFKHHLLWGIDNILKVEELIETKKVDGRNRLSPVHK